MRHGFAAALAVVVLAGCGGGAKKATPDVAADKQQIRAVSAAYLKAVSARNYKAVCATRAAAEQAELAKTAGSCAKAFALLLGKQPVALFRGAKPTAVRIQGDLAGVDVVPKGGTAKFITLAAVREGGGWKLKDVPDQKVP